MLLQENKWEFVLPDNKLVEYNKKEYTCMDGWIKEKAQAILVVEGLKREINGQYALHQNLKNFVIPVVEDEDVLTVVEHVEKEEEQQNKITKVL